MSFRPGLCPGSRRGAYDATFNPLAAGEGYACPILYPINNALLHLSLVAWLYAHTSNSDATGQENFHASSLGWNSFPSK